MMTTLIDDGLVESCWDDPISLMDYDQVTVIDIDEIDATIEDPGNILDETPDTFKRNEEYKSTYRKRSSPFALPATFFDISRNISLLQKCRPISIKVVDCDIYPWYYKKIKNINNKEVSEGFVSEINDNIVINIEEENTNLNSLGDISQTCQLPLLEKSTSECNFDKNIDFPDLVAYKAIAQTIIRNIDHSQSKTKTDNVMPSVQSSKMNKSSDDVIVVNNEKLDRKEIEKKGEERERIVTSPILPYTMKLSQKSKTKEKMLRKSSEPNNLEKCTNSNKHCDKFMSSINQVIPHYHCILPVSASNTNNLYFPSMVADQMYTQFPQLNWNPPVNKNDNCSREILPGSFNRNLCSYSLLNSSQTTNQRLPENINPTINTNFGAHQFHYQNSLPYISNSHAVSRNSSQVKLNEVNKLRLVRPNSLKKTRTDNCRVYSQSSTPSTGVYDNSLSIFKLTLNQNIGDTNSRSTIENNKKNVVKKNPLLSQLLNYSDLDKYHHNVCPKSSMKETPQLSIGQKYWLPPMVSFPSYGGSMSSSQFNHDKIYPYPNAGMRWLGFPSSNLSQNKSNSNLNYSNINSSELTKFSIPTNLPTVMKSVPPIPPSKVSMKLNICAHTEAPSTLSKTTDPRVFNKVNAEIKNTNNIHLLTCTSDTEDKIKSNLIDNKKSNYLSSEADKGNISKKKLSLLNNNVLTHLDQSSISDLCSSKARTIGATKTNDINLQSTLEVKSVSSEQIIETKISGYSPPILPIPSFKKSLEMLSSELHHTRSPNAAETGTNKNIYDKNEQKGKDEEYINMIRKRKHDREEKMNINSKRISLQEYKIRRLENGIVMT